MPAYSRPDMDWDDACELVATRFPKIEREIEAYLTKHGAVIAKMTREKLNEALTAASHNKFGAYEMEEDHAAAHGRAAAAKLLDAMGAAEVQLFELVKNEARVE